MTPIFTVPAASAGSAEIAAMHAVATATNRIDELFMGRRIVRPGRAPRQARRFRRRSAAAGAGSFRFHSQIYLWRAGARGASKDDWQTGRQDGTRYGGGPGKRPG